MGEEMEKNEEENKEELTEVEVWEFALDEGEIDNLIGKLNELKETKKSFGFEIDGDNELLIHYDGDFKESEDGVGGTDD